jgi:hypothetical protein
MGIVVEGRSDDDGGEVMIFLVKKEKSLRVY